MEKRKEAKRKRKKRQKRTTDGRDTGARVPSPAMAETELLDMLSVSSCVRLSRFSIVEMKFFCRYL